MTHSISKEYALKVNGLSYNLPNGTTLLNSVSFNLHAGEILALVGLNGSGKTTLIRLLAGLLVPSLGNISFSNRAFEGLSITERARQIAYFGQHDDADGRLLVNDFVGLGLFPHRSSLSSKEIKQPILCCVNVVRHFIFRKSKNLFFFWLNYNVQVCVVKSSIIAR